MNEHNPRCVHDGQFHMLITGPSLICTEVAGNAITPDVSFVYRRVSAYIDIERYCLYQPPMRLTRYARFSLHPQGEKVTVTWL